MPKAPTYRERWPVYAELWDKAKVVNPKIVVAEANAIFKDKGEYLKVESDTKVPWWWIACVHMRESSRNWSRSLAQGDPWNRVSVNVPRGRGPFRSFRGAAYDALVTLKGLDKIIDWRLEKGIYQWERYNGFGYFWYHPNTPSPYLWASTSVQKPGKYVSDGKWSSTAFDTQLGCCAVLKALMLVDPTVNPQRED